MNIPRRFAVCLFVALTSLYLTVEAGAQETRQSAPAQTPDSEQHASSADQHKDKEADKETPVPAEKLVTTHHELALNGRTLKYTATAGTLIIRDEEDKPYGSMFYVAYTLDGAEASARPVSFLYNGGPGSATL
ncbi:MAG TPA: hypothetical protein VGT08_20825 [Terracidiphilus sp.]|nr:hypothetical protein [Terracidiphilus sp.]